MNLVTFGDSNTRYWLGNTGLPGPLEESWPVRLEPLLRRAGRDVSIRPEGCPGGDSTFAQKAFRERTQGADLVLLSFGTNDIKRPDISLEDYLANMEDILRQNQQPDKRPLVVLSILWFEDGYGFPGSQKRLPMWNAALQKLCEQYQAWFLDTTPRFENRMDLYNDKPVHHLNAKGQTCLALEVRDFLQRHGI